MKRQAKWPGQPPPQVRGLIADLGDLEDDGSAPPVADIIARVGTVNVGFASLVS